MKRRFEVPHLRWWIMGLIFLATLINYLDRLTVSILAPVIRERLHLSNVEYATLGSSFLLGYTISQGLSGKLYDQIGTRLGFMCSVVVWSVAAMLHAVAGGLGSLNLFRFVLGLGEAGSCRAPRKRRPSGCPHTSGPSDWRYSTAARRLAPY
jgi:ACS family hexuronate transporter-like MFS transporter